MLQRVSSAPGPWPLHDRLHARAAEARALAGEPAHALMGRAGRAVARLCLAVAPHARRVAVLAGPGNNGGDALLAALHLHQLGRQVQVQHIASPGPLPFDAADAMRQALNAGVEVTGSRPFADDTDLVIDGLLGLGATRPPADDIAIAIQAAHAFGKPVLAIDLPTGLHPDTGALVGNRAIQATWTLSLLTLKPGLFTAMGRDHAGDVWFDDLGASTGEPVQAWLSAATRPPDPGFPSRRHAQHKGSFGDLTVVGGAPGMQGAAVLAALAALRSGAGRVYVRGLGEMPALGLPPELMLSPPGGPEDPSILRRQTVVCGCGAGQAVADALPELLDHAGRLLLDADALNAIAGSPALQRRLRERTTRGDATVLTPHPLEAARLLGRGTPEVQRDRLASAAELVDRFGATVVLKGSGTIIAAPGRCPWINASGNAALAAPGTGDVLAGWIGGVWSQQDTEPAEGAWFAARASVWLHGRAADRHVAARPGAAGPALRASHLPALMAQARAGG